MIPTREELALNVDEAEWNWLRAHLERGGLIVVVPGLDIVEVGASITADDAVTVNGWIADGNLAKPTVEQVAAWDSDRRKRFRSLIVSPYVLIQEIPVTLQ